MKTVIFVNKDGDISGLSDDVLDRLDLGFKRVHRVSNIEYDHQLESWVATDMQGKTIAANPVRSIVVHLEREYYNQLSRHQFELGVSA